MVSVSTSPSVMTSRARVYGGYAVIDRYSLVLQASKEVRMYWKEAYVFAGVV